MNDVLTELLACAAIPVAARPFVYALCNGEGGVDSNAWVREYGGGLYTGPLSAVFNSANPLWSGKQGPAGISHAFGAGQFQPATYQETAARTGLPTIEPQSQLTNIWSLMQYVYGIKAPGASLEADLAAGKEMSVASFLSATWTSLALPKFATYYTKALNLLANLNPTPTPTPTPVPTPVPGPTPTPSPVPTGDLEFAAMQDIYNQLINLDSAARKRVLAYINARLAIS